MKIMASGLITLCKTDGETMETVRLYFGASKITADGECSHEIKRRLFLGRKVMTNLGSILKSRHITLPTKVHQVKAMFFPVVRYGCENGTMKKVERQRIAVSTSASVLPMNIQDWFPLGWTGCIFLQSKGLSRVFFNTTAQKHLFFSIQLSLWSNSLYGIHTWPPKKP